MSVNIFNESMTSNEARIALFRAVDGKSKAEIEKILADYEEVNSVIMKKELKSVSNGWITD